MGGLSNIEYPRDGSGILEVDVVGFTPLGSTGSIPVTQSTSPWVVSGTVSVLQSTSPWVVSGTITGTTAVTQATTPWVENLTQVGGTSFSLSQQATTLSLPVVLTAAQQTALTPLGTVAVTQATSPWTVNGTTAITGAVAVTQSTSPWVVSGTVTANQGTANATPWSQNITQVGGTAFSLSQQATTLSLPVVLTAAQQTALSPLGTVAVTQATTPWAVNQTQINGTTIDTGAGNIGAATQRITIATNQTALSQAGVFSVKLDQTTPGTTNAISLTQIGSTTVVNAGFVGTQAVGGGAATNVAIASNPMNTGAQGVTSENAAVTTGRMVQLVADVVGKLIVSPYANKENAVKGNATATGIADTSVVANAGSGIKNYINSISVFNTGATTASILIKDGSGGTTLWQLGAPAGGGNNMTFPIAISGSASTAVFFASNASSSTISCSIAGYKGV